MSEPDGGGAPAVVRAELAPTGQLSSIMLDSGGAGYLPDTSPVVTISAPSGKQARRAQAVAKVENGKVVRLDLTDRGRGYRANDVITVKIDPPLSQYGLVFDGVAAEASAELENGIKRLVVDDGGEGYARDQNLTLTIAPPLQAGGRGAAADLRLKYDVADLEALSSEGPYAEYYPEDSVSTELIQLLPSNVRPTRLPDGNFSFRSPPRRHCVKRLTATAEGVRFGRQHGVVSVRGKAGVWTAPEDPILHRSRPDVWAARHVARRA